MAEADLNTLPGARAQLLDTASAIMREGDVVDISLSELSLRSGLNSALVKYYFGNKAGLLKALLDRDWQAIVSSVDALVAKGAKKDDAILQVLGGQPLAQPAPTAASNGLGTALFMLMLMGILLITTGISFLKETQTLIIKNLLTAAILTPTGRVCTILRTIYFS